MNNQTYLGFGVEDTLTCTADGFPQPNVTLLHLEKNSTMEKVASGIGQTVYSIAEVSKNDAGRYECIAENLHGRVTMVTTVMIVGQSK